MNENELAELDLAVAKAEGLNAGLMVGTGCVVHVPGDENNREDFREYHPSTDPKEAMRLMIKYQLRVEPIRSIGTPWACGPGLNRFEFEVGATPAIAICRATVALKQQ